LTSDGSAAFSKSISGIGSLETSVQGRDKESASEHQAQVLEGTMQVYQSIQAEDGISSGQSAQISGFSGGLVSAAISGDRGIKVEGTFDGRTDLDAILQLSASDGALASGWVSVAGMDSLNQERLGEIASGEIGVAVSGLYRDDDLEIGSFSLKAQGVDRAAYDAGVGQVSSASSAAAISGSYGARAGRFNAYLLESYRWSQANPSIAMYVRDDDSLRNKGLDPNAVRDAVAAAMNTWNSESSQRLFSGVSVSSSVPAASAYDGYCVHYWAPLSTGLAMTTTWYRTDPKLSVGGFASALESDVTIILPIAGLQGTLGAALMSRA
jgi:hypothetical protein